MGLGERPLRKRGRARRPLERPLQGHAPIAQTNTPRGHGQAACHPLLRPFVFPQADTTSWTLRSSSSTRGCPLSPAQCLANIRVVGPEGPGWLITAYSVLSQVTHQTPLGVIHGYHNDGTGRSAGWLSPPMEALAIEHSPHDRSCKAALVHGPNPHRRCSRRRQRTVRSGRLRAVARSGPSEGSRSARPCRARPRHLRAGTSSLSRLGRNAPCLCDSGRKSKQCHGVRV